MDISIVIPTYNRMDQASRLVKTLLDRCRGIPGAEIVVVDDGSSDQTAASVASAAAGSATPVIVISQSNKGRAAARNKGIAAASGSILLFLDDDVEPCADLISRHLAIHEQAEAVVGRITHGTSEEERHSLRVQSIDFYQERHRRLGTDQIEVAATDVFAGNLSVKRAWIEQIGGFDESFSGYGCEDWDLGQRLLDAGARILYCPAAEVIHHSPTSTRTWLRNAREEAESQLLLIRKHPQLAARAEIGGLYDATLAGRLVAHGAVTFPAVSTPLAWLGMGTSTLVESAKLHRLAQRLVTQSWRLAFWSGVRRKLGSAAAVRSQLAFHGRILCYHRVTDDPNPALAEYAIRPADLRRQLEHLRKRGYTTLTVSQLVHAFEQGMPLHKAVALTFDDGYQDLHTVADPILKEYDAEATVFVVSGLIGESAKWDREYGGQMAALATVDQIRALADSGWEIGHHTRSHPDLTTLGDDELRDEISVGQDELKVRTGLRSAHFAYPFGLHNLAVREATRQAGFTSGLALGSNLATPRTPRFELPRTSVLRRHSLLDFRLLLWIGLDLRGATSLLLHAPIRMLRRRPKRATP